MAGSKPTGGSNVFGPPVGGGTTYRFGSGCGNNQSGGSGGVGSNLFSSPKKSAPHYTRCVGVMCSGSIKTQVLCWKQSKGENVKCLQCSLCYKIPQPGTPGTFDNNGNPYPPPPSKGNKNGKNNGRIANSPFEDPKVKLLEEQNAILQKALKQHNIQLPTTQKNTSEEDAKSAQEEIQRLLQKGIPENEIPPSLVKIAKSQTQAQNENKNEQTIDELQLERKLNNARKQLQKKTVDYN